MIVIEAFYRSVTVARGTGRRVRGCIFHLKTSLISNCFSFGISKRKYPPVFTQIQVYKVSLRFSNDDMCSSYLILQKTNASTVTFEI